MDPVPKPMTGYGAMDSMSPGRGFQEMVKTLHEEKQCLAGCGCMWSKITVRPS